MKFRNPFAPAPKPDSGALLHYQRGNEAAALGNWEGALAEFDQAIVLEPGLAKAHCNRGVALLHLQRHSEALASFGRAVELNPDDALAYFNRAALQRMKGDGPASLASYDEAIARKEDYGEAHFNRAVLLSELKRWETAIAAFQRALALNPAFDNEHTWFAIGTAQQELQQWGPALASMERVIALRADNAEAHYQRGNILRALARAPEAIASFARAIEVKPDHALALQDHGLTLHGQKRFEEAVASYDRALALRPDLPYLAGIRRYALMNICDWASLDADLAQLSEGIRAGRPVAPPFALLALLDSAPLLRSAATIWAADSCPPNDELGPISTPASDRIRVGYFSADFRMHPVSLLTAAMYEAHDRAKFEITAFAFGPKSNDEMRQRLLRAFDRFVEIDDRSDTDAATLARRLNIDIAVDLGGFTEFSRPGIFARRAAPLQVGYLGFLGTMGAGCMDYLIADATLIPAPDRAHYSEKIIYLPAYHANDAAHIAPGRVPTREELGLPPGFVFACCNSNYKILPATFAGWMRILSRVNGSALFLTSDNPVAERNLRVEAARHGIDPARIVFGQRVKVADYLARYKVMDLFLDTMPYNAGTTASDALWSGLPVLTLRGATFSGRVAAGLLNALGIDELVTDTQAAYEELAVALACDPPRLAALRLKLDRQRAPSIVFNSRRFTQSLEAAFTAIVARQRQGLAPDHIHSG